MRQVTEAILGILQNADISHHVIESSFDNIESFDLGLRSLFVSPGHEPYDPLMQAIRRLSPQCLYHFKDIFHTEYAIIRLPDNDGDQLCASCPVWRGMVAQ